MRYLIALMFTLAASSAFAATCDTDGRFTVNGDGTVTDSKTGLTWKQCLEGQTFAAGPPAACNNAATFYTWQGALGLTANGFRVPNIKELQSIVDEAKSTLVDPETPGGPVNPAIDTACFPTSAGVSVYVWSASPYTGDTSPPKAWLIDFNKGIFMYQFPQSQTGYVNVRLVKDPQ
ncbi:DUF1566 domain-containing protein [Candidatus Electronema sp. PJ]|uniref:Lcl C-terminal domain-containing protein n=1 Tax=Candidatus Electronema sp. PJ TaxID=3401572 RepID=UPI003AA9E17F